jgi:hypothetical protein
LVGPARLPFRPLSRYPFTDIAWTISEFSPVSLAASKQFHGFTVDERHVLEIDSQCARFLSQRIPERVHMFSYKLPSYAQHDKIVSANHSVDSAAHYRFRFYVFPSNGDFVVPGKKRFSRGSKPYTILKLMKTKKGEIELCSLILQMSQMSQMSQIARIWTDLWDI